MSFGGGSFTTQNKVLPGTYINFVSAAFANPELSDRGIATMPLELDWGVDDEIFTVSNSDFQKSSLKFFGYEYTNQKLKGLRDLFLNITTLHAYKINSGGEKAKNVYGIAKYSGARGNDLKTIIQKNADDESMFDVKTLLDVALVDKQTVTNASELIANDYVEFKTDAVLGITASTPFSGGTNGEITGLSYQTYLDKAESYTFNAIGIVTTDNSVRSLLTAFTKRMRDEMGKKFQAVLFDHAADYMGVVNVKNVTADKDCSPASLVYWVTGIIAGCAVNKSNQNKKYNGEFSVEASYTQAELIAAIKDGEFTLHKADSNICVLDDINSMVTTSDDCGEVFKSNQSIRTIDQIANDDAVLFNSKYSGIVPNKKSGRISLWLDLVKIRTKLQEIGAIENFVDTDVTVEQGDSKKAVIVSCDITVVNAIRTLYMTVKVA